MSNFFELLNQPMHYDVDLKALELAFIQAQKQNHPDNFVNQSGADLNYQQTQSALINEAYKTLCDPFKRAVYYLLLHNIEVDEVKEPSDANAGSMNPAFLMEQMEIREALENANSLEMKAQIYAELGEKRNNYYGKLAILLKKNTSESMQEAVILLKELRFWNNILLHKK